MKYISRSWIFGILLIMLMFSSLIVNLAFVSAAELYNPVVPTGIPGDNPTGFIDEMKNKTFTEWDYLGREWQKMFLSNKVIAALDSVFKKISFLFKIVFGEPYSLSITLFCIIIIWVFLFLWTKNIVKAVGFFKPKISILFSLALVIIVAQTGLLKFIVSFIGNLVFSEDAWWVRALTILIVILGVAFIQFCDSQLSGYLKAIEKKKREKGIDEEVKNSKKFRENFKEGKDLMEK